MRTQALLRATLMGAVLLARTASANPCVDYRRYLHTTATLQMPASVIASKAARIYISPNSQPPGGPVVVLDATAPDSPVVVGQLDTSASALAFYGEYLLLTSPLVMGGGTNQSLVVVDVSNPASPQTVGSVGVVSYARAIVTSGTTAFVAATGVQVVDLTNPSAPVALAPIAARIGGTPKPTVEVRDVAIVGNLLLALSFEVNIFDVSDPSAPVYLGSYVPVSCCIGTLEVVGEFAYVGSHSRPVENLSVVDISNPAAPILVSSLALGGVGFVADLVVEGDRAYIGSGDEREGLCVVDVSTPASPVVVGAVPTTTGQSRITVLGDRLYAVGSLGLSVVDIDPALSPPAAHVDTPGDAQAVAVSGTHAYVADGSSLQVVDVSDRFAPRIVGSLGVEASAIAVDGTLALTANGTTTYVLDISDPTAPAVLGSMNQGAYQLELVGSRAYKTDGNLDIIDVSNPASPVLLGSSSWSARHVEVHGQYAYTTHPDGAIMSIEVHDITGNSPVLVGRIHTFDGWRCEGFGQDGAYVFCSDGTRGHGHVYDVADPAAPYYVSESYFGTFARSVEARNNRYYTLQDNGELWVYPGIGVSPPPLGAFAARMEPPASHYGRESLAVAGGLVLVAAGTNGLYVLPDHCDMPTDVVDESTRRFGPLFEAWPSPARGPLSLRFSLARGESVRLRVYDVAGRRLRDLVQHWYPAGTHVTGWDGRDERGREVGSGVYQVLLTTPSGSASVRVVIVR